MSGSCGTQKNPHHCSQRVGDVDPLGVANLSWAGWVICNKERSGLSGLRVICNKERSGLSGLRGYLV